MSNSGSEPAIGSPAGSSLVVVGVGNRLRGDDAVGCIVCDEIRDLPQRHKDTKSSPESDAPPGDLGGCPLPDGVFVLDCGSTPENYVQPIAERKPARILIVDCCDYGAKPGEFRLFSRPEIDQLSYGLMSTHTLPLTLTIDMLGLQTKATIELLGVQPRQIEFGTDLSPALRAALPALVQCIRDWASEP